MNDFTCWSTNEVIKWLIDIGLGKYEDSFTQQMITGDVLPDLTDEHLKTELSVTVLGHRLKLKKEIQNLLENRRNNEQNIHVNTKEKELNTINTPILQYSPLNSDIIGFETNSEGETDKENEIRMFENDINSKNKFIQNLNELTPKKKLTSRLIQKKSKRLKKQNLFHKIKQIKESNKFIGSIDGFKLINHEENELKEITEDTELTTHGEILPAWGSDSDDYESLEASDPQSEYSQEEYNDDPINKEDDYEGDQIIEEDDNNEINEKEVQVINNCESKINQVNQNEDIINEEEESSPKKLLETDEDKDSPPIIIGDFVDDNDEEDNNNLDKKDENNKEKEEDDGVETAEDEEINDDSQERLNEEITINEDPSLVNDEKKKIEIFNFLKDNEIVSDNEVNNEDEEDDEEEEEEEEDEDGYGYYDGESGNEEEDLGVSTNSDEEVQSDEIVSDSEDDFILVPRKQNISGGIISEISLLPLDSNEIFPNYPLLDQREKKFREAWEEKSLPSLMNKKYQIWKKYRGNELAISNANNEMRNALTRVHTIALEIQDFTPRTLERIFGALEESLKRIYFLRFHLQVIQEEFVENDPLKKRKRNEEDQPRKKLKTSEENEEKEEDSDDMSNFVVDDDDDDDYSESEKKNSLSTRSIKKKIVEEKNIQTTTVEKKKGEIIEINSSSDDNDDDDDDDVVIVRESKISKGNDKDSINNMINTKIKQEKEKKIQILRKDNARKMVQLNFDDVVDNKVDKSNKKKEIVKKKDIEKEENIIKNKKYQLEKKKKFRKNLRYILKDSELSPLSKLAKKLEENAEKIVQAKIQEDNNKYKKKENKNDNNNRLRIFKNISLDKNFEVLKNYQIEGVKFIWKCCVLKREYLEDKSIENLKLMGGCILGDEMGLGKTLQVIAFINTFFSNCKDQRCIIIVPANTLYNWKDEFTKWLPKNSILKIYLLDSDLNSRERMKAIKNWSELKNGVLLVSSSLFVQFMDSDGENYSFYEEYLCSKEHGPTLVVCDEGFSLFLTFFYLFIYFHNVLFIYLF